MLIVCLAIIAAIPIIVVEPLVISNISGWKITKNSMLYVVIVNGMLFLVFSNVAFPGYVQEFFEPIIYLGLLQIFSSRNIKINLFYTAYTVSFVYFIRMLFSTLIFRKLLGESVISVLFCGILGYLCVIPAQNILLKILSITPKRFIISDQEFTLVEKVGADVEKEGSVAKFENQTHPL